MPRPLDSATVRRIGALTVGEGFGPAETQRRLARGMDGGAAIEVSRDAIRRNASKLRREGQADVRPSALAGRMLRLVERELAALEQNRGKTDLERLDKLAATLKRLETVGPSKQEGLRPSLASLAPASSDSTEGETNDLSQLAAEG